MSEDYTKAAKILSNAQTLLSVSGWCQHYMFFQGKRCALGALAMAASMCDATAHEYAQARSLLVQQISDPEVNSAHNPISTWNDQPGQTLDNVLRNLRNAERQARADR